MFQIAFTLSARRHLGGLRRYDSKRLLDAIESQLSHRPAQETRNRKRLRPNELAEWELRIGRFRVFYDVLVPAGVVKVEAVGYKEGNQLFISGKEYDL
jgi:mRNA-degrading endonuclease RelE of RelBE toxin-antitoxin system